MIGIYMAGGFCVALVIFTLMLGRDAKRADEMLDELPEPEPSDDAVDRWSQARPSACCCLRHSTSCCQVHGVVA